MKKVIFLALLAYPGIGFSQFFDLKQYTDPKLKEGQCHTLADSKVYLKNAKENAKIISEIGEAKISKIENSETESYFFCKVKCQLQSETHFVWITQKDQNSNFKKLEGFVCSGLDIKDVAVSSTLSIKTAVATPFSAINSNASEIHEKLKSISYKLNPDLALEYFSEFYKQLKIVRTSYSAANSSAFRNASAEMAQFLPENSDSVQILRDRYALAIFANETAIDFSSSESIVNLFLRLNGRFLSYIE